MHCYRLTEYKAVHQAGAAIYTHTTACTTLWAPSHLYSAMSKVLAASSLFAYKETVLVEQTHSMTRQGLELA